MIAEMRSEEGIVSLGARNVMGLASEMPTSESQSKCITYLLARVRTGPC
jgi:hypothetical protein